MNKQRGTPTISKINNFKLKTSEMLNRVSKRLFLSEWIYGKPTPRCRVEAS